MVKSKVTIQDLDVQQAPPESQLPDNSSPGNAGNGMDISALFSVKDKVILVTGGAKG